MEFHYEDWFKQAPSVGYETLIYDCMIGDATLFQRADQVEAAWAWSSRCSGWESVTPPLSRLYRGQRRAHRRQ